MKKILSMDTDNGQGKDWGGVGAGWSGVKVKFTPVIHSNIK